MSDIQAAATGDAHDADSMLVKNAQNLMDAGDCVSLHIIIDCLLCILSHVCMIIAAIAIYVRLYSLMYI